MLFYKELDKKLNVSYWKAENYCMAATISYLLTGFIGSSEVSLQIVLSQNICQGLFQDSVCYHQMISKNVEQEYFQNII